MKIAICDNNRADVKNLRNIVMKYKKNYSGIDCYLYYTIEDMIAVIRSKGLKFEIVFMEAGKLTGTATAHIFEDSLIILLSNSLSDALSGYELGAYRFVLKPLNEKIIGRYFLSAIRELNDPDKRYTITVNSSILTYNPDDILYLESAKRRVFAITKNERIGFYSKLGQEEAKLRDFDFIRVHQGFLVNMAYIKNIIKNEVILSDGTLIPISKSKKREALKAYIEYVDIQKQEKAVT